ncbi:MAG: DUF523 domain-containing protein [Anaerovoracaceae bacterium]
MYIISECLLGRNCKYNGGNNKTQWVLDFAEKHSYCSVCPELLGGLKSPRAPAEIVDSRVINNQGIDITTEFEVGSKKALDIAVARAEALGERVEGAILKSKSPSCGCGQIYDGTFEGRLTQGNGVFAQMLVDKDIKINTDKEKIDD